MSTIPKIIFISFFITVLPGCATAKNVYNERDILLCEKAKSGNIDTVTLKTDSLETNAFLLDCAMAVRISGPKDSRSETQKIRAIKMETADLLLKKNFDPKYVNEDGNTLLITAILSFFPDEWKTKTVKLLLDRGVDKNHKNNYGATALSLAKQRGSESILLLLQD
jgi:ankyrin repeat protein